MTTASEIYRVHMDELMRRARDDDFNLKTIFIISLLTAGWRYDPEETNVVDLASHKAKTGIRQTTHSKKR